MLYDGNWAGYKWIADLCNEKSDYGIYGGRILKLIIYDPCEELIINYDKKWYIPPKTAQINKLMFAIIDDLENNF